MKVRLWSRERVWAELRTLNPFVASYRSSRVCVLLAVAELLLAYHSWELFGAGDIVLITLLVLFAGMNLGQAHERSEQRERNRLEYAIRQVE